MLTLRPYQQRTIEELYAWFGTHPGNPCIVMPTGSGKSIIIAELCRDAVQNWPETRILVLSHVKELLEQDANKILAVWPEAPIGIYSASIGSKRLDEPITVAGIQSVRTHAAEVGHVDLIIVDEAHLINHKAEGGYRKFIADLSAVNPQLRVIGLTATPYRLGHGLVTDKPAIFDDLINPTSIEELQELGHLCHIRSKLAHMQLDTAGVAKRGGEYVEHDLQKAVDTEDQNERVVDETIQRAGERQAWLFFCSGVAHAEHMRDILRSRGVAAEIVTGETPKSEREQILTRFKRGEIRALTNANVLTTGFDYPDIDLIAMCRPTMSPGLYMQMAGRGLRPKTNGGDCIVLDFAGNVSMHGPITGVKPPDKKETGTGEAPVKVCPNCDELVAIAARICPGCGFEFPPPEPKKLELHDDDIMGNDALELPVNKWRWERHISLMSGREMLRLTYFGGIWDTTRVTEYFPVTHVGYAGYKAQEAVRLILRRDGAEFDPQWTDLEGISERLNGIHPPTKIRYRKDGKFFRVLSRDWNEGTHGVE